MLIEDHAGMREVVWDSSFMDLEAAGPFAKDHRYAIVTKGSTGLVDLGCWDQAWPEGGGWTAPAPMMAVSLTQDGSGAILSVGGGSTWLPVIAAYAGKGTPTATLRGAYLNWLLAHRGTTPSIPKETHWQRLRRGAETIVRDLLSRGASQPEFRVVGIGTSGRLLIPPGEGLQAGLNAVAHMEPSDSGRMPEALNRALETMQKLRASGACEPGIVLPVGDGWTLDGGCGAGKAYEPSSSYTSMLGTVRAIRDTGEAEVWAWSVDGPRTWSQEFGANGAGRAFSGDAVADLDAAIKAWMARHGQPLQLTLAFDQPALTRVPQVTLSIRSSHGLLSATLNGQPIQTTGLETQVPLTLSEGLNTFTVSATDLCGGQAQASTTITLDTIPPHLTLNPVPPALTNQAALTLQGRVDDPTATLTLNGQPVALDPQGGFSVPAPLQEGPNTFAFLATDPAGNPGRLDATVVCDTTPPVITLNNALPAVTKANSVDLTGSVNEPVSAMMLNGAPLPFNRQGFATPASLAIEGTNTFEITATDLAGNVGKLTVQIQRDTTPPVVRFETPQDGFTTNGTSVVIRGMVDDPSARLTLMGKDTPLDPQGGFEATVTATKEGPMAVRAEVTDSVGNIGRNTLYLKFDFTPPILAWANPTPVEGATLATSLVPAAVVVNEAALTSINGRRMELEPSENASMPFLARTELDVQEGHVLLRATAVDGAGNSTSIERMLDVGLTQPRIVLESPSLDGAQRFSTANPGVSLVGRVEAPDFVKPLVFTVNGQVQPLTEDGRFNTPVALSAGLNPFVLVATTKLGQSASQNLTVLRTTEDVPADAAASIQIDWPQNGFASGVTPILVKGRVNKASVQVVLAGQSVSVDPQTLQFSANVALTPGANRIQAVGTDAEGRSATAEVQGTYVAPGFAKYSWEAPIDGAQSATRTVRISGQADQPGILSVMVNGVPMALSGDGSLGRFNGEVGLSSTGRNTLLMEVRTLAGETRTEKRDVIFEPELPRIRLMAPDSARPGDTIPIQVSPEAGTKLLKADLTWNGRFLATVTEPFGAVSALVPADAVVGSRINLEAVGTGAEGATVTARAYVTVFGSGALMIEAYDDRLGLPLADKTATASVEGGESQTLDEHGRAALATALPQNWIKVSKAGFTTVWRSAALQVGSAQSLVDARLTPMEKAQDVGASGFTGEFAGGALNLSIPAGAPGKLSVTPLSAQGLPGLLPWGWSAVSAWWIQMDGTSMPSPGTASLTLPAATPALPADARYVWARWDETAHVWMALAAGLPVDGLANLSTPSAGGYALLMADSGATAPPAAVVGSVLAGYEGQAWRDGIKASGSVDPSLMPTVDAIRGARATAIFGLAFEGSAPLPSGVPIQADVVESYALLDAAVIEPDGFSQDAVASRWMLEVVDGKPVLTGAGDGLGLRLPLHMSRTFGETELVEGRIFVGFYHDGVQVAQSGSELLGASGGVVSRDGVNISFASGSLSGTTLVRLGVDGGDASSLWPELVGKGALAKSFSVDIVGTLLSGLGLSVDTLDLPDTARPLVLQRRVVQGERLVVVVGELRKSGTSWVLVTPTGGNAVLEGGSFAVLVPSSTSDWISGTALLPNSAAQPLMQNLGVKARMMPVKALSLSPLSSSEDVAVADVVVDGGFLLAASGATGAFAVPVWVPADASAVSVKGERRDLGVTGSFSASVPSSNNLLRLATVPFRVLNAVPANGAVAPVGSVVMMMLSGPADPVTLTNAKLFKEVEASTTSLQAMASVPATNTDPVMKVGKSKAGKAKQARKARKRRPSKAEKRALDLSVAPALVEIPVRRSLSQDGKTIFLTPEQPLELSATYRIVADGLLNLGGEAAPTFESRFQTAAVAPLPSEVDFSRIKLSYPDTSFNVTVTIPEGALPPWAVAALEANGMGSYGTGTMPDKGDLVFTLKASLGERLKIRVQLKDGRVVEGFLSRYESNDGSGRVTLGIDGGRVEAADGSCSVTLPEGTLDHPVEFKAQFVPELPDDLLPEAAVPIWGRVQLLAKENVAFAKIPRIEAAAPAGAEDLGVFQGFGTYAVCFKNTLFGPDGQPASVWEFLDTAKVKDGKLEGLGGLPWASSLDGLNDAPPATLIHVTNAMQGLKGRPLVAALTTGVDTPQCPVGMSDYPVPQSSLNMSGLYDMLAGFGFAYGGGSNYRNEFTVELDGMIVKNPGKVIYKGRAKTQLPETLGSRRYETVGAPVFYSAGSATDVSVNGRLVQRTSECGTYMVMNAMFADDPIKEGGAFLGVEPDYGISQVRIPLASPWMDDQTHDRKLYQVPDFIFEVQPVNLTDHTAPWADAWFEGTGVLSQSEARASHPEVYVGVGGYDLQDKTNVTLKLALDGREVCGGDCQPDPTPSTGSSQARVWRISIPGLTPGLHVVVAAISDKAGNITRIRKEITALDLESQEPPVTPGQAPRFTLSVNGDISAADPGTAIRVAFSEPVTGLGPLTLFLNKVGAPPGQEWVSGVRIMGTQGEAKPSQQLYTVYLLPSAKLELGATYEVVGSGSIHDFNAPPLNLGNGQGFSQRFTVTTAQPLGQVAMTSRVVKSAALGGRFFVATDLGQISYVQLKDGTLTGPVTFGVAGSGGGDFLGQDIVGMQAFRRVNVSQVPMDLLIVTTQPTGANYNQQGALWVFNACSGLGTPKLLFGMSTGQGAQGYVPSVGCKDGVIAVGRIASSIQLVDIATGMARWNGDTSAVIQPQGNNTQAVFQPFWLAGPEYLWNDGTTLSGSQPVHWSLALTPCQYITDSPALQIAVGYSHIGAQWRGLPLTGLPLFRLPYEVGKYKPMAPFVGDASSVAVSQNKNAPPASAYVHPGKTPEDRAPVRIASWPRATVMLNGVAQTKDLVVGVSAYQPDLKDSAGGSLGKLGNALLLEDVTQESGQYLGAWPTQPPFGAGVGYEILRKIPEVDALTGLIAVPVQNLATSTTWWFVIDFKDPAIPKIVYKENNLSSTGGFSNGVLFGIGGGKILAKKVVGGIGGVDEGDCYTMQAHLDMAVDGTRSGDKDLVGNPGTDKCLFWVNDDCDATSYKWWDEDPTTLPILVEDDQQAGDVINLVPVPTRFGDQIKVVPNCSDEKINGLRDLEDFARLHLRVDASTDAFLGVTYWMRFEPEDPTKKPAINLFPAIDETTGYLTNPTIANDQVRMSIALKVGSEEVGLAKKYIRPDGVVSPFLLEGATEGKGRLILTARLNGTDIGHTSIDLELLPITKFYDKYVVEAGQYDTVPTHPDPNLERLATYTSINPTDEYCLYVHGWNMAEWEKDRWAETTFKRLWWLGYRGRVGIFEWPTLEGFTTYDHSEFRAWKSGGALMQLLHDLDQNHPGQVRVVAHSMGNVVMGEALREAQSAYVHTYVAAQAAVPAHLYDPSVQPNLVDWGPLGTTITIRTPDLYRHFPSGSLAELPYFAGFETKILNPIVNYYNEQDYALNFWWNFTQKTRPDNNTEGCFYDDKDGNIDSYIPDAGDLFHSNIRSRLTIPQDTFEIFSYYLQPRSWALGRIGNKERVKGFGSSVNLEQLGFDKTHYSHSKEFRSNLPEMHRFWDQLKVDFKLDVIPQGGQL
jgi:hypothetical protein